MLEKIYQEKYDPFCSLSWQGPKKKKKKKKDLFMLAKL